MKSVEEMLKPCWIYLMKHKPNSMLTCYCFKLSLATIWPLPHIIKVIYFWMMLTITIIFYFRDLVHVFYKQICIARHVAKYHHKEPPIFRRSMTAKSCRVHSVLIWNRWIASSTTELRTNLKIVQFFHSNIIFWRYFGWQLFLVVKISAESEFWGSYTELQLQEA